MMTWQSLIVMSSKDGSVLVVCQRDRSRRSATSAGACPAAAYQRVTRPRRSAPNGSAARPPAGAHEGETVSKKQHPAVADLLAWSNRLGSDPANTNYAGGNASAKGEVTN